MPFNLVRISQQDPQWKSLNLGDSNLSIGAYGCALTCVAMYLSGFGYLENSSSLNTKMKSRGDFADASIVWSTVCATYPSIRYQNLILCRDTDAPLDMINRALAAGQPVMLEVDNSPNAGLQTHWVLAYQKVGQDFLILDPWPYPSDAGDVSLMARYSQGNTLKRSITAAVFYEFQGGGAPEPTSLPTDGYYVRVLGSLEVGLRLRSQPTTAADTVAIEPALTNLQVLEDQAVARTKAGAPNQWLNVGDANGMQGYVAAWYVENAPLVVPLPTPPAAPQRSRQSVAAGLESVNLPPVPAQLFSAPANASPLIRLLVDIWNRYGGLLGALSGVLKIRPAVAVAVLAIESGGQAFGPDGRMLIRFENHIFYQYWGKNHADPFNQYFRFNSGQTWTGHQWRPTASQNWIDCHASPSSEWDVFNFACSLDATAARMSISMGAPQIMGFNYAVIGYPSVDELFAAFAASERDQVIGFFDFVAGMLFDGGAVSALQKLDYTTFATSYNGSGQADYYAGLMKSASDAFSTLKFAPSATPPTPPVNDQTMNVIVGANAARPGLSLLQSPAAASQALAVALIGSRLRVLDDPAQARARIGSFGQWIAVKDDAGRHGYVDAAYVIEAK